MAAASAIASAAGSDTLSMPPGGTRSNSCPRSSTSRTPSRNPNTPARQAAVFSPMLCPPSADGWTPHDMNSFASAYSTMKSSGSWIDGRLSAASASASAPFSGSHSGRGSVPVSSVRIARPWSIQSRNSGSVA